MQININKQKTKAQIIEKMKDLATDMIDHTYAMIKYGKVRVPGDLVRDMVTIQILTRYNRLIKFLEHLDGDNKELKDVLRKADSFRRVYANYSAIDVFHVTFLMIDSSMSRENDGMILSVFHQMVPLLLEKMKEKGILDVYDC